MRDFEKLVKKLRYCRKPGNCNLQCPRFSFAEDCLGKLTTEAADAIEELTRKLDAKESALETAIRVKDRMKAAVPRWIGVEERLPEDQGDDARAARGGDYIHKVLAASVTPNYTVMDTAYLENGIWSLSLYTSWKQIIGAPVTHWMPLPAPPKEELNKNVE